MIIIQALVVVAIMFDNSQMVIRGLRMLNFIIRFLNLSIGHLRNLALELKIPDE